MCRMGKMKGYQQWKEHYSIRQKWSGNNVHGIQISFYWSFLKGRNLSCQIGRDDIFVI